MNCVSTEKKVDTYIMYAEIHGHIVNKGNNKITELRTILQRGSQNS